MSDERPSKKQKEVFDYIETFINENGFGPSYREVMRALGLKSVSTVATHVDGLIARGLLVKKENSARSLQVVSISTETNPVEATSSHLKWLREEVRKREANEEKLKEVEILKAALTLLDQTGEKSV